MKVNYPPQIALLHASRGRPEKAIAAMKMWHDRAFRPDEVAYFICVDPDDKTVEQLRIPATKFSFTGLIMSETKGSAPAWNFASKFARSPLLVQMSDDMEPPQHWDKTLLTILFAANPGWRDERMMIAVGDGHRKDKLMTTVIMTRKYREFRGSFIPPEYQSVYSDDEVTYRAYRDQRDENCRVIEARDIIFYHRHHWHDKSVPMDETYQWQNRNAAYDTGARLFNERNPLAHGADKDLWQ